MKLPWLRPREGGLKSTLLKIFVVIYYRLYTDNCLFIPHQWYLLNFNSLMINVFFIFHRFTAKAVRTGEKMMKIRRNISYCIKSIQWRSKSVQLCTIDVLLSNAADTLIQSSELKETITALSGISPGDAPGVDHRHGGLQPGPFSLTLATTQC